MNRRDFIKSIMSMVAAHSLSRTAYAASSSVKMPVLFFGHGSPMNALKDNEFTQHVNQLGKTLPTPRAIVVISAHWVDKSTKLSSTDKPETIYDFGGFPKALYELTYPSDGEPELAKSLVKDLSRFNSGLNTSRGLDHGAWTVLYHLYPEANIPVIQLAMSTQLTFAQHVEVGMAMQALREEGILIIGSGNIVHNLGIVDRSENPTTPDWANGFDFLIKQAILQRDFSQLLAVDESKHSLWRIAHPTLEHYVPLLYSIGASTEEDSISFPYEAFELGTLSMRSVKFG